MDPYEWVILTAVFGAVYFRMNSDGPVPADPDEARDAARWLLVRSIIVGFVLAAAWHGLGVDRVDSGPDHP